MIKKRGVLIRYTLVISHQKMKLLKMKYLIIALGTLFLYSCASNPIKSAPTSFTKESKTGAISGTISIIEGKPRFNSYDFYYRQINQKEQHRITIKPDQGGFKMVLKPDYTVGDTLVFQYLFEHPPGQYEFFNYSLFNNLGYSQSTKRERKGFSIPFSVKEGQITYLGDMVINTKEYKQTGTLVRWINNGDRELTKFKGKFSSIDWSRFQNETIKGGEIANEKLIEFVNDER